MRWDRLATVGIAVAGTWPFAGIWRGELPGDPHLPVDGAHSLWVYEVVRQALLGHGGLIHTTAAWFPVGQPLLLAEQNLLDAFLAAPFLTLLGPQHGLALFVLVVLLTQTIAAGWLGEVVGGRGPAGPVAASLVAFNPYLWGELFVGRYTQTFFLPSVLTVVFAWKAAQASRGGVATGVTLGITGLAYWFYGAFTAVLVGGLLIGGIVPAANKKSALRTLILAAAIPILVASAPAAYIVAAWWAMPGAGMNAPMPLYTHFWGGLPWVSSRELIAYVPQLLAIPAVMVLVKRPSGPVVGIGVATLLLGMTAAGDTLEIGALHLPTPLAALRHLPGFDRFWWPHRALGAVTLGLAVLLARAASQAGWMRRFTVLAAVLSAGQASWYPVTRGSWSIPPKPAWDAALPPGPVLILPMLSRDLGKRIAAEWVTHHRPLVNGKSMWEDFVWPADYRAWTADDPFLRSVLTLEESRGRRGRTRTPSQADVRAALSALSAADLAGLRAAGVSGIVAIHAETPRELLAAIVQICGNPDSDDRSSWWALAECPEP